MKTTYRPKLLFLSLERKLCHFTFNQSLDQSVNQFIYLKLKNQLIQIV